MICNLLFGNQFAFSLQAFSPWGIKRRAACSWSQVIWIKGRVSTCSSDSQIGTCWTGDISLWLSRDFFMLKKLHITSQMFWYVSCVHLGFWMYVLVHGTAYLMIVCILCLEESDKMKIVLGVLYLLVHEKTIPFWYQYSHSFWEHYLLQLVWVIRNCCRGYTYAWYAWFIQKLFCQIMAHRWLCVSAGLYF